MKIAETQNNTKKSRKRKRSWWIVLSTIAVVAVVLGGCAVARQRARAANALQSGDVVAAFIGDLSSSASASGQLLPKQEARLALGMAGKVENVYVRAGDQVQAGDVLVQLETGNLQRAVESAEQTLAINTANLAELLQGAKPQDVAAAQASVDNAQAQLDDLLAGPSEEELAQAQAALDSAQAQLDDLLAGPSQEELAQAQAALNSAKAALETAQARYAALDDQLVIAQNDIHTAQLGMDHARDMYNLLVWNDWKAADSWAPYSPQGAAVKNAQINYDAAVANYTLTEININDSAVRSAETQVAQANATLAALTKDKTAQIAAAEAQVARAQANLFALTEDKPVQIAAARAQLAQAKSNLAKLSEGASEEQIAIAKAQVEQARISLQDAQDNLAEATLLAPFAGTVATVYVSVGEQASGLAVDLINTNSLQVVLNVDEIDVGTIEVGQPTVVTLETWPDLELPGEVVSIAPNAQNIGGIVSYEVRLSLNAGELPILTGMTANADLITAQRKNVLLVPNRAIIADREAGKYYVNQVRGEEITKIEVTIGLRDSTYTEITSGLEESDQVYIGTIDEGFDFRNGPPEGVQELR
ncbi:MAG: efflux RND transporter periplasmic adaptor subunit [Anaerolineae bacterium]|nr:efflux RND transporter periplasmic adaptor subunit [Anaerolineae bacterium]